MRMPTKRIPPELHSRYNEILPDIYADFYGRGIDVDEGQAQCIAWDKVAEEIADNMNADHDRRSAAGEHPAKLRLLLCGKMDVIMSVLRKADENAPKWGE